MRLNESLEDKCSLFIRAYLEFSESVRSNKGLDEEEFEKFCFLLKDLKAGIQEKKAVPLSIAGLFIDLYSAVEATAYRHKEEMKQRILLAADELADIARDVVLDKNSKEIYSDTGVFIKL